MIKKVVVFIFFLSIGLVYLHNLTRDIYSGDIGDLVTAAYVGGVAHAPGYPLFTLLGLILTRIPLGIPPVSQVGLISVFSSLVGLVLLYKFSQVVTKSIFLALLNTSFLAFSYFFWLHAEIPEVFGLNNFFAIVLLYFAFRFYQNKKVKDLYLLAFFSGLSLTHHHTIITLFPSLAILSLANFKLIFKKKRLLILSIFFLIGFSIYLYVPIAASRNPVINWDSAYNLKNFLHLLLRKDYDYTPSIVHGVPIDVHKVIVGDYFKTLFTNFSYQVIFLALLGALFLIKNNKIMFSSLVLGFLLSGPVFVFYGASPVATRAAMAIMERFYSLSAVVLIFFVPYGMNLIENLTVRVIKNKTLISLLMSYFLIVPFYMIKYNFPKTQLSNTQIGNELAQDILKNLAKNAVLMVHGDTKIFNIWYARYALGVRKDVEIINPPRVGGNVFFDEEINKYYQKYPKTKKEEITSKVILEIKKTRPIFATYDISGALQTSLTIPRGMVYQFIDKKDEPTLDEYLILVEKDLRKLQVKRKENLKPSEKNLVALEIPRIYSEALVRIGDFIDSHYKSPKLAEHYYRRALWIDDGNPGAYAGLGLVLFKGYNDCQGAIKNLSEAISIYKIWKPYYGQLYIIYKRCNTDKKIIDEYKRDYFNSFKENIEKLMKN